MTGGARDGCVVAAARFVDRATTSDERRVPRCRVPQPRGRGRGRGRLIRRARGFPTTMIDHERTNEETRGGRACRSLLELGAGLDGAPADQTPVLFDATTEGDLFADLGAHGRGELQLGEIRLDGDDAGAGAH